MVKISLHTFERIQPLRYLSFALLSLIVKIENQSVSGFDLYGFSRIGKRLFRKIISVSGVGAGYCRGMMLSTFKPDEIKNAILTENE